MNQEKIGKYIASCRKKQNLTQEQLGEKLGITSKAISKWECGNGLPDVSIMLELCDILDINIIDLLSGEDTNTKYYIHKTEGSMIKKVTMKNALKKVNYINDLSKNNIAKIKDINKKTNDVTFEVIINGFDIIETKEFISATLEVSDDTGEMTAIIITNSDNEVKKLLRNIHNNEYYRMKGIISLKDEVKGNKLLTILAIEKV